MLLQLFVINRSGGLIYNRNISNNAPTLSTNDWLRMGSTFHSLHAIVGQVAPIKSDGINKLDTDTFTLLCLQTLSGVKFVVTAAPGTPDLETFLKTMYELYSDYVLKNPFHEMEMPIRSELFNKHLDKLIYKMNNNLTKKRHG